MDIIITPFTVFAGNLATHAVLYNALAQALKRLLETLLGGRCGKKITSCRQYGTSSAFEAYKGGLPQRVDIII